MMQILITHLTRMQEGYFCAAGLSTESGRHIRPVLNQRLPVSLLWRNGGPFSIGAFVELGPVKYVGVKPEVEDHRFETGNLKLIRQISSDKLAEALSSVSQPSLASIFGSGLQIDGGGMSLPQGTGPASLGCIECKPDQLSVDFFGKVRLSFTDGVFNCNLPVTDLPLFEEDQKTPRQEMIAELSTSLRRKGAWVNLGLSRPFKKPGDSEWKHWLQVNNVHLKSDPLGCWAAEND